MLKLSQIKRPGRLFYTREEIAQGLGITPDAAKMLIGRRMDSGEILRLRRDFYVLKDDFDNATREDFFRIANSLQTPSYISYGTALNFYDLSTQIPQSIIESANPTRSKSYTVSGLIFRFYYCRPPFYFGFDRQDRFFIAWPEKALLDCLLLVSLGKYALDERALDLKNIQWRNIEKFLKKYPKRFQNFFRNWRARYEGS